MVLFLTAKPVATKGESPSATAQTTTHGISSHS